EATLPPGIGAAAGRQAAFAFSQDILSLAVPDTTTTTTGPTTTTSAPTTTTTTAPPPPPPPSTTSSTTATTTAPAPAPRTRAPLPPDTVYSLIATYFNAADVERAMLVAWCESRYDANATHPSSRAAGLFQHLPRYWESRSAQAGIPGADIYDPTANTIVAAWLLYSDGGWKHWNASKSCWGNGSVVAPSTTTTTTTTLPPTTTTTVSPTTVPPPPSTTTTTVTTSTTSTTLPTSTTSTTLPPSTTTTVAP
ncbi:MAG: transglycosylase SLT domain-containing protein, partial [Acidimicrobiia bacterium]|nr:transglycosylase SLT domain-containing protein [Acidimicrobiia bacterium]